MPGLWIGPTVLVFGVLGCLEARAVCTTWAGLIMLGYLPGMMVLTGGIRTLCDFAMPLHPKDEHLPYVTAKVTYGVCQVLKWLLG